MNRAQKLIDFLGLEPHPEGGYYKETYRSDIIITSPQVAAERHAVTDIYFLLTAGQFSRFHRVRHDELWHFYEGDPLRLYDYDAINHTLKTNTLGSVPQNDSYKYVVVADHWQAAEPLGEYSLVGCCVAPGFDFHDFCFFEKDSIEKIRLLERYPDMTKFV